MKDEKVAKAAEALNKSEFKTKIDTKKLKGKDLQEAFMKEIEKIVDADDDSLVDKIPELCGNTYNALVEELEGPESDKEEKEEKEDKKADKKPETKKGADKKPDKKAEKKTEKKAETKKPEKKADKKKDDTKKKAEKKPAAKKEKEKKSAELDDFGYRKGTKVSQGLALFRTGKYTMNEVKEEMGGGFHFYKILKAVEEAGHKVEKLKDGKVKVTPKK